MWRGAGLVAAGERGFCVGTPLAPRLDGCGSDGPASVVKTVNQIGANGLSSNRFTINGFRKIRSRAVRGESSSLNAPKIITSNESIHAEPDLDAVTSRGLVYAADLSADLSPTSAPARLIPRFRNPRLWMESRPLPPLRGDMLRLRMLRVGICGTDLHLLEQDAEGLVRCTSPLSIPENGRIIGHEGVGVVEAIGPDVTSFHVGEVVSCESIVTCGVCKSCRRGHFNQCAEAQLLGLQSNGLFAEWADVPSRLAHRVDDLAASDGGLDSLACVEPAAVAFLACQNARVRAGESVLVIGGGPIGYYAAMLAGQQFGASRVSLVERSDFRRQFAGKVADTTARCDELVDRGLSFDVVIEAAGALSELDTLLSAMRPNGRIVLLARIGTPLAITRVDEMITKSLTIVGSRGHLGGAFDAILSLMRAGRIDLRQAVTRSVVGLSGLLEALQDPAEIASRECKVVADLSPRC